MYRLFFYKVGRKIFITIMDRKKDRFSDDEIDSATFYVESEVFAEKIAGIYCPLAQVFELIKYYEEKNEPIFLSKLEQMVETFFKGSI